MPKAPQKKKQRSTGDGILKKSTAKRAPRKDGKEWKIWLPRLIALYIQYNLSQTCVSLEEEGFKAEPRQLRHQIEKVGLNDKYKTAKHEANMGRGRTKNKDTEEVPPSILTELSKFWLALKAEKKAFPLLTLLYYIILAEDDEPNNIARAARAAIARARTATNFGQKDAARRELIRMASNDKVKRFEGYDGLLADPQEPLSLSRAHVFSAYHAFTYGRREQRERDVDLKNAQQIAERDGKEVDKALKNAQQIAERDGKEAAQAPKRAATALKHLFGPEQKADEPRFSDSPLGSHLDFLSYFGTWYCLGASQDEDVIRDSPFRDHQRERIQSKCLSPQPAIRDMDSGKDEFSTHIVRDCISWMKDAFSKRLIAIPPTLKEVVPERCRAWRDEMELFVAVWYHYLRKGGAEESWSKDCEEHLSIYPAELLSLVLRCVMKEVPSHKREDHPFLTPPADDGFASSNYSSRAGSPLLTPVSGNNASRQFLSPYPPSSPYSHGGSSSGGGSSRRRSSNSLACTPATEQRREELVSMAGECIQKVAERGEKEIWESLLDGFVDMNRLDNLGEGHEQFKQEMVNAIDAWVDQEVKKYVPTAVTSSQPSPLPLADVLPEMPFEMDWGSDMAREVLRGPRSLAASSDLDNDTSTENYDVDMDEDGDQDTEEYACMQPSEDPIIWGNNFDEEGI